MAHSWILAPSASSSVMSMKKLAVLSGGNRACTADTQEFAGTPERKGCCQLPMLGKQPLLRCSCKMAVSPQQTHRKRVKQEARLVCKAQCLAVPTEGVYIQCCCSCHFLVQDAALSLVQQALLGSCRRPASQAFFTESQGSRNRCHAKVKQDGG